MLPRVNIYTFDKISIWISQPFYSNANLMCDLKQFNELGIYF